MSPRMTGVVFVLGSGSGLLALPPLSCIGPEERRFPYTDSREGGTFKPARVWGIQLFMTGLEAGLQGGAWKGALEKLGPQ